MPKATVRINPTEISALVTASPTCPSSQLRMSIVPITSNVKNSTQTSRKSRKALKARGTKVLMRRSSSGSLAFTSSGSEMPRCTACANHPDSRAAMMIAARILPDPTIAFSVTSAGWVMTTMNITAI